MRDQIAKAYLCLLLIVLPMDWFGPTGELFREAGAKPAIPLMMLASLVIFGDKYKSLVTSFSNSSWLVCCRFFGIFACGVFAFTLNLIFGWSQFGGTKNPSIQFVTQAGLFIITPLILVMHGELLRKEQWTAYILRLLPWVVSIHLLALSLDMTGMLAYNRLPLSMFRTGSELVSMRISGLFSEPSYFGTMAAMYGIPLMLIPSGNFRRGRQLLALLLFAAALCTGGKTLIPVAICGFIGYFWYSKTRLLTPRNALIAIVLAAISIGVVAGRSALDVQENLSSAMRFGSTLTSINAAIAGYGVTGVGFGQFHFMYLKKFMPSFLLFSEEAIGQMASTAEHRASTYNIFSRYLIEEGVLGLCLFIACLRDFYKLARNDRKISSLLGVILVSASLGFLLTQEPYCYPPLILGAALIIGGHNQGLFSSIGKAAL